MPAIASAGTLYWEPTAAQYWAVNHAAIVGAFQNGQCTQWAENKRRDIVKNGVEALITYDIAARKPEMMGDWNAKNWTSLAKYAGMSTGHSARAHAIMVFQAGALHASSTGHVAYVERVNRDGSFLISNMNAPLRGHVTFETFSASSAHASGISFIY